MYMLPKLFQIDILASLIEKKIKNEHLALFQNNQF